MKKSKYIELEILDFGQIIKDLYQNDLINLYIQIPSNYKSVLKTIEERRDYNKQIGPRVWFASMKDLSWTGLISLTRKDEKVYLKSQIRKIIKTETEIAKNYFKAQIKAIVEQEIIDQNFEYQIGKKELGEINFDFIEFSEVKYVKGNSFALPSIKLIGIKGEILIQITISFYDEKDKNELLDKIEIKKEANR